MADVHDPATRSYNMSRIRGKNTKPELLVRKFLFTNGFRYRLHKKELPGNPDIVLKKFNTVIFINGCFWHGHANCQYFVIPKTRTEWWLNKINHTKENDMKNHKVLKEMGWNVVVIWECQLKKSRINTTLEKLQKKILKNLR